MIKTLSLAAVVAASALISMPAAAADLRVTSPTTTVVHIPLAGKSADQVKADIRAAANLVCGQLLDAATTCFTDAVDDATHQYNALVAAHNPARLDVARGGPSVIRISIAGKTPAQLDLAVRVAAESVCKAVQATGAEHDVCVSSALDDAKSQLMALGVSTAGQSVAAR